MNNEKAKRALEQIAGVGITAVSVATAFMIMWGGPVYGADAAGVDAQQAVETSGWEKIPEEPKETEPVAIWTQEDEEALLRIAMAEAGNQDTAGKALVMRVVLNRVNDAAFPCTPKDVIFQKYQFSPVWNGVYKKVVPDEECYEALELVRNGWDDSQGALYFNNTRGGWHESHLQYLFSYGAHNFYR